MIVLDASVLIAQFDARDAHHDRAEALLLGTADEALAASLITLAEVLVGPVRADRLDEATAALHQLDVRPIALDQDAPTRLALLRAGTGLKLPDCCVLLAAEQTQAAVATFDDRLASTAQSRNLEVL